MNVPLHQQQNKCTTLVKNKTATAATALQFTYPVFTANACSANAGSNPSQVQVRGQLVPLCSFVANGSELSSFDLKDFSFAELNNP